MGLANRLSTRSLETESAATQPNSSITHDRCTLVKHRVCTKPVAQANQLDSEHGPRSPLR